MPEADWVRFGTLGRAHGLKGEIRFFPLHADSEFVADADTVEVRHQAASRRLKVTRARMGGGKWLLQLEGIRFRDQAEALVGWELWVPATLFPQPEDGEFYGYQLQGLRVVDPSGEEVGEVLALVDFGAGDLLEVRIGRQEIYVPFAEPYVGEIDLEHGTVEVDATDWLPS